jgi:hypothetical protein
MWYYEHPLHEDRRSYTKTNPLDFEEFRPLLAWWDQRKENERAWRVAAQQVIDNGCNLDLKNPRRGNRRENLPPDQMVERIIAKERQMLAMVENHLTTEDARPLCADHAWPLVPLGQVLAQRSEFVIIDDTRRYQRCRVQLRAQGVVLRDVVEGMAIKTKSQQVCRAGEFLVAEIDAKHGGFGIVPDDLAGAIVSSHYFLFVVDEKQLDGSFLGCIVRTQPFQNQVSAQGSTNYAAIRPADVLGYRIPLPPLEEQRRIVDLQERIDQLRKLHAEVTAEIEVLSAGVMERLFGPDSREPGGHTACL